MNVHVITSSKPVTKLVEKWIEDNKENCTIFSITYSLSTIKILDSEENSNSYFQYKAIILYISFN